MLTDKATIKSRNLDARWAPSVLNPIMLDFSSPIHPSLAEIITLAECLVFVMFNECLQ